MEVASKNSPGEILTVAERKAQFVRQGEIYRIGLLRSKAQVLHEAQPQTLFHTALDHAAFAVRSRVDRLLSPSGFSVGALLPYALPLLRMVRHHRFGKKSRIVFGAVAVAAAVGVYFQQRRKQHTTGSTPSSGR